MLDIGWSELLVIAVVMIVVVGPKDLPKMLRAFGKATAKLRATASEFRTHFDEAMREAELDEVKKTIDGVKQYDPRKTVTDIFEPVRTAGDDLRNSLNNASPKPDETPAVPMDSPLDLSEMKEEEVKAAPVAQPAAAAPVAAEPVKKATKPRAKKAVTEPAEKPAVKPVPKKSCCGKDSRTCKSSTKESCNAACQARCENDKKDRN
jgi:sec-independent protein translocase protein TatB